MSKQTYIAKQKRHWIIRKKIVGTIDKPRMSVFCSLGHIYVQLIDDINGNSLAHCSTLSRRYRETAKEMRNNKESAKKIGQLIAQIAQEKGIKKAAFDRSGYKYHGKVRALAEGAREGGLSV